MGILSRSYNLTNTESNSYRREVAKRDEDEERERKEEGGGRRRRKRSWQCNIRRRGGAVVFRGFPCFRCLLFWLLFVRCDVGEKFHRALPPFSVTSATLMPCFPLFFV